MVPANERSFVDEMTNFNFPLARSLKLKEVMGYDKHRIVEDRSVSPIWPTSAWNICSWTAAESRRLRCAYRRYAVAGLPDAAHQQRHPGTARPEAATCSAWTSTRAAPGFVIGLLQSLFASGATRRIRVVILINVDVLEPQNLAQGSQQLSADRRCGLDHGDRAYR